MSKRAADLLIGEQADGHSTLHSPAKQPRRALESAADDAGNQTTATDSSRRRASFVRDNDDHANVRLPLQRTDDFGINSSFLVNIMRPTRVHPRVYRVVTRSELDNYSSTLYHSLLRALYPDGAFDDDNVITERNFTFVVQYILHSRIHYVYSNATGRRVEGRIPLTRNLLMPTSLARIINQYGQVVIYDGMVEVSFALHSFLISANFKPLGRSTTLAK